MDRVYESKMRIYDSKNDENSWWTPIDKAMFWKFSKWVQLDTKSNNLILRIHYDHLILASDDKIFESINMNSKIRGIYKGDVLIIIIGNTGQDVRKLKFRLKDDSLQAFRKLGEHFPVHSHSSSSKPSDTTYRNIDEVLRMALENNDSSSCAIQIPPNYEQFVKLCLIDPTFPHVVQETQKVIDSLSHQ